MSKSLGNLVMVRELLETWSPDALRLYLARHHYRQAWSFDHRELEQAGRLAQKLRAAATAAGRSGPSLDPSPVQAAFTEAMDEDLSTPMAVGALERLADRTLDAARAGGDVGAAQEALRRMGRVFGLRLDAEGLEERVVAEWNQHLKGFTGQG
jgi:cysteinyl-tRNA synthetase